MVGAVYAGAGGECRPGVLIVSAQMLERPTRDALVAHELGHFLLGHEAVRALYGQLETPRTLQEWATAQARREMDANAKAVEILVRVRGLSEGTAVRHMLTLLRGAALVQRRGARPLVGHAPACDEMRDLLARFPADGAWTESLMSACG